MLQSPPTSLSRYHVASRWVTLLCNVAPLLLNHAVLVLTSGTHYVTLSCYFTPFYVTLSRYVTSGLIDLFDVSRYVTLPWYVCLVTLGTHYVTLSHFVTPCHSVTLCYWISVSYILGIQSTSTENTIFYINNRDFYGLWSNEIRQLNWWKFYHVFIEVSYNWFMYVLVDRLSYQ